MITTNLRLPEYLHRALKKSAKNNRRSMNNEILEAIDFYLRYKDRPVLLAGNQTDDKTKKK